MIRSPQRIRVESQGSIFIRPTYPDIWGGGVCPAERHTDLSTKIKYIPTYPPLFTCKIVYTSHEFIFFSCFGGDIPTYPLCSVHCFGHTIHTPPICQGRERLAYTIAAHQPRSAAGRAQWQMERGKGSVGPYHSPAFVGPYSDVPNLSMYDFEGGPDAKKK